MVYKGAGFVVPLAGAIKLTPDAGSDPAFRRTGVDVARGSSQLKPQRKNSESG